MKIIAATIVIFGISVSSAFADTEYVSYDNQSPQTLNCDPTTLGVNLTLDFAKGCLALLGNPVPAAATTTQTPNPAGTSPNSNNPPAQFPDGR